MTLWKWDSDRDRDREQILKRLNTYSPVKICAKALNEAEFTEGWIEHHLKIFGPHGVIIADNGTTDERVLKVYDRWKDRILIFQFEGPHNLIHCQSRFSEFFRGVSISCVKFAFIDIDERLVRISSNSWCADPSIANDLAETSCEQLVPTSWLINKMRSTNSFYIRKQHGALGISENLRMGKPFFPSSIVGRHCEIHNFQYFSKYSFDISVGSDLFLMHFTQFPERRIMTNRNKLISRGVVTQEYSDEDILSMDVGNFTDKTFMPLIDEMRWMKSLAESKEAIPIDESDMIKLMDDGTVFFSEGRTSAVFSERRRNFECFFREAMTGAVD